MKRILIFVLTGVVVSGLSWGQTLSGTYTIAGSSPNYATISLAIADINSATTITGKVTFFNQGDIGSEPGGTITSSLLNSSDRIVLRPAGSTAPVLVSTSDLHFQGPLVIGGDGDERLTGTDLTATVADDIDGHTRRTGVQSLGSGQTGPYMGADESTNELPIQLTAIAVTSNRLDAVLRWSTATEVNNHGFEIERRSVGASAGSAQGASAGSAQGTSAGSAQGTSAGSAQGSTSSAWAKVGFVSGSGTRSSPKDYSYVDAGLPAGRYAYRIKQVDNDGSFTYYLAAEVEVGVTAKVLALESNYPNPFNPSTNIAFSVPENGKVALKVFNILGQEVAVLFDGIAEAGKLYQQTFNASQFPTGLYFSRLEFGGKSLMRKMLFVK